MTVTSALVNPAGGVNHCGSRESEASANRDSGHPRTGPHAMHRPTVNASGRQRYRESQQLGSAQGNAARPYRKVSDIEYEPTILYWVPRCREPEVAL